MKTEISEGIYPAKPTCCGLTTSKNGFDQFAIEVAIEYSDESGKTKTIHLTKFGGLDGEGLEYTVQDAETVGCDTSLDIREWTVDSNREVRAKVIIDEYGLKLKSIFPLGGGGLIKKQAMDEAKKTVVAETVNARIAALRAKGIGKTKNAHKPALQQDTDDDIPF